MSQPVGQTRTAELENSSTTLFNVHDPEDCAGRPCAIHNRTDHHMRGWEQHWRDDRGIMERICPHGVGHPDPDQYVFWKEQGRVYEGIHGCDGCCNADPHMQLDPPGESFGATLGAHARIVLEGRRLA